MTTSGMEMRYPWNQEIRRPSGKLQKLYRVYRRTDRIPDHNGIQWSGKTRYHLQRV